MWKYFTAQGNYKCPNILPIIINKYNNTVHSTIGMKRVQVDKTNEIAVLNSIINNRTILLYKEDKF